MTIKIGDRVRYGEEHRTPDDDVAGTVAEPTVEECLLAREFQFYFLVVEWDDGLRFWEDPASLVALEDA